MNRTPAIEFVPAPLQAELSSGLAPIDFADCYQGRSSRRGLLALELAHAMFDQPPPWVSGLMAMRNRIVGLFGLKTPAGAAGGRPRVGIFPLLSATASEVVLGLDDKHLDFRIWVSVREEPQGARVAMSTLVRFNGFWGRAYLFAVMPFHKLLCRHLLARAIRSLGP